MRNKYIDSTSVCKFVTRNGFSDPDLKGEDFSCKPTFKVTLSKLVNNRKLNYAHARKSLPVASPKKLFLFLAK